MSISTLRMSKKTKASQARMTFPHPSRILHLKPREEKIQRTKLFPIYIQRDSPKMSKTSRSLWATAAIGIRSRLPEQPSARENHRKSTGSGHQASRCAVKRFFHDSLSRSYMNYLALSGHWHSPYELIRAAAKLLQEMPFFAALLEIEA